MINNAYNDSIKKIIYNSEGNLISCSFDGLIKIWELKNGEYKNIKTLNHTSYVESILLLENKNILISAGFGFKFWNLTNDNIIFSNNYISTDCNNGLELLDEDKIIICNDNKSLIIISISKLKIIKEIKIDYECNLILNFENVQ